jgi:hypothetical protein
MRDSCALAVATHTSEAERAIAAGSRATVIVSLTLLVAGSMRETVASCRLTTHTPDSPAATATGRLPTRIARVTVAVRGSTRNSVPVSSLVIQTAPAPMAIALGGAPRWMTSSAPSARIRETVLSTDEPIHTDP